MFTFRMLIAFNRIGKVQRIEGICGKHYDDLDIEDIEEVCSTEFQLHHKEMIDFF